MRSFDVWRCAKREVELNRGHDAGYLGVGRDRAKIRNKIRSVI